MNFSVAAYHRRRHQHMCNVHISFNYYSSMRKFIFIRRQQTLSNELERRPQSMELTKKKTAKIVRSHVFKFTDMQTSNGALSWLIRYSIYSPHRKCKYQRNTYTHTRAHVGHGVWHGDMAIGHTFH